jgi:hypothetical protein
MDSSPLIPNFKLISGIVKSFFAIDSDHPNRLTHAAPQSENPRLGVGNRRNGITHLAVVRKRETILDEQEAIPSTM